MIWGAPKKLLTEVDNYTNHFLRSRKKGKTHSTYSPSITLECEIFGMDALAVPSQCCRLLEAGKLGKISDLRIKEHKSRTSGTGLIGDHGKKVPFAMVILKI